MRVARVRSDESGAVLVIVALSLIALLGFAVLAIDVGGLLIMKRGAVRAADAAALAAAQSCSRNEAVAAPVKADELAESNISGIGPAVSYEDGDCDRRSGSVTVEYSAEQRLFFAPVLGFPESANVNASATAIWGAAGMGPAAPVAVSGLPPGCTLPDTFPTDPASEIKCHFLFDNPVSGQWGWLNTDQWDVAEGFNCSNPGADDIKAMLADGSPSTLTVNSPPDRTLVCSMSGFSASVIDALNLQVGNILWFPVVNLPTSNFSANHYEKFDAVGFIALRIVSAAQMKPGTLKTVCPSSGYITAELEGNNNKKLDLVQLGVAQGCFDSDLPAGFHIDPIDIDARALLTDDQYFMDTDWTFNDNNNVMTWKIDNSVDFVRIRFSWTKTAPASCGVQTTNNSSAFCLTVSWPGPLLGQDPLPGGPEFGARAVRLSEDGQP